MKPTVVRIFYRESDGSLVDSTHDYPLDHFAGQLPVPGDRVLYSGVARGLSRREMRNRRVWDVVGRFFNPMDNEDYVALIVEEREPTQSEAQVIGAD